MKLQFSIFKDLLERIHKEKKILVVLFFLLSLSAFSFHFYKIIFVIPETVVDFWQYYEAGQNLQLDRIPYFPGNLGSRPITYYPPSVFPLFFVFSLLPASISLVLWQFLSLLLLIGSISIILKALKMRLKSQEILLIFGIILLSFPIKDTFWLGSINFLELLLFSLAFFYYLNQKQCRSGIFIGLAAAIRPFALIYLIFFFWKKDFKTLLVAVVIFFISQIISIVLFGFANAATYYLVIWPWLILYEQGKFSAYNQALLGFLTRQFGRNNLSSLLNGLMSILLMGINLMRVKRRIYHQPVLIRSLEFSSLIPLIFMIKSYSWRHHGVLLLIPLITMWQYFKKTSARQWKWWLFFLVILLFIFGFSHPPTGDTYLMAIFGRTFSNLITSHFFIGVLLLWLLIIDALRLIKSHQQ